MDGKWNAYAYRVRVLLTRTAYAYRVRALRTRTAYAYCVRVRVRGPEKRKQEEKKENKKKKHKGARALTSREDRG